MSVMSIATFMVTFPPLFNAAKAYEVTAVDKETLKEPFCYIARRISNPGRERRNLDLSTQCPHLVIPHPSLLVPLLTLCHTGHTFGQMCSPSLNMGWMLGNGCCA